MSGTVFALGRSPFRVKGLAYRGWLESVDRDTEGGLGALTPQFRDRDLAAFLGQRFLSASWYDLFPLVAGSEEVARILGRPHPDAVREWTRKQAERDIHGIYRLLLRVSSPSTVAMRLPRLTSQYFDFGEVDVRELGRKSVVAVRTGMPAQLESWYTVVTESYVQVALALAGAKSPKVRALPSQPGGTFRGVAVVTMSFEMSWD